MSTWVGKKCRCGAPLMYAAYDIKSGEPQQDTDYWCSDGDPRRAPHDWGVVKRDE